MHFAQKQVVSFGPPEIVLMLMYKDAFPWRISFARRQRGVYGLAYANCARMGGAG